MFFPKTNRIGSLRKEFSERIQQLEGLFVGRTNFYIDYANMRPWANNLGWHVDLRRLKQFLNSFNNIQSVKIYYGTLVGDCGSECFIRSLDRWDYEIKTKPVKIIRHSIDVSSIKFSSLNLLTKFIRRCLLRRYDLMTIEYLNRKFKEMNNNNVYYIEDLKCNFDVEIGCDMLLDYKQNFADTFVLWSGDSDFADPVEQLLDNHKEVILFATARRVSSELNGLRLKGLIIFDIQKIRNFICWKREMQK